MDIVIEIVLAVVIFGLGVVTGFMFFKFLRNISSYDGSVQTVKTNDKITYVLEINEDPELIQFKNELILKVQPLEE